MLRLVIAFIFSWTALAAQEEIVLGLSRDQVAITATFEGSEILIFGAIRRDSPLPLGDLGVIVTVAGPSTPVVVRRKERRLGIWVNAVDVKIDAAPSFYAVASSGTLTDNLRASEDLLYRISHPQMIRDVGNNVLDSRSFSRALMRIRQENGLYLQQENSVNLSRDTLFNTSISLPANLTEGNYTTRIFLTRDGTVVDTYTATIPVQKVGLERWLYTLAQEQALLYGLLSLLIAISAGWGASAVFGLLRR
tara:strand:+ start:54981 stop:55730 length:750 start_codon:yes stop_codon:yes gene_type:complete